MTFIQYQSGETNIILTESGARNILAYGHNIRCNCCGSYGAQWVSKINGEVARPGWGALALCPYHARQVEQIVNEYNDKLAAIRKINFEQTNR